MGQRPAVPSVFYKYGLREKHDRPQSRKSAFGFLAPELRWTVEGREIPPPAGNRDPVPRMYSPYPGHIRNYSAFLLRAVLNNSYINSSEIFSVQLSIQFRMSEIALTHKSQNVYKCVYSVQACVYYVLMTSQSGWCINNTFNSNDGRSFCQYCISL